MYANRYSKAADDDGYCSNASVEDVYDHEGYTKSETVLKEGKATIDVEAPEDGVLGLIVVR